MTINMKTSKEGLAMIAYLEGMCLSKYLDSVGVQTIGIGATESEIPDLKLWSWDRVVTIEEAINLLKTKIVKYENSINKVVNKPIPQYQFDALVSWCYNVGIGWPHKATVIKYINKGVSGRALYDALMMFNRPHEIIGRRRKEANLLKNGVYAGDGKTNLFPVDRKTHLPHYTQGKMIDVLPYL